jgi:hypothetical protein
MWKDVFVTRMLLSYSDVQNDEGGPSVKEGFGSD